MVHHHRLTPDVVDAARKREQMLGDTPGWIAVHDVIGRNRCTCAKGADCQRAGKHPAPQFPDGSRGAVSLSAALEGMGTGQRLAGVLSKAHHERVLDADTPAGLMSLWRGSREFADAWLTVRTPRGMHLWQMGITGHRDTSERMDAVNRSRPRGLDIKVSGIVVWPDGASRWLLAPGEGLGVLAGLLGGVDGSSGGGGLIEGAARPADPLAATGGSGGLGPTGDPVDLHVDALNLVRNADEGSRNDTLNFAAWRCRALVAYAGWPAADVAESLYRVAVEVGLDRGESVRTVRSGLNLTRGQWDR